MDEAIPIILTQPVVLFQLQLFKKRTGMVETALFFFLLQPGTSFHLLNASLFGKSCLPPHVINEHVAVV